ncbi:MAG: hypothetical protein A2V86_07050 [Deltaproteobacteria bacterium RBG_16_49_23]|nr:MAG: hypothetical protein A2V86_07050 [Deltaproteobacteria bacterium RBG_16_49_23]
MKILPLFIFWCLWYLNFSTRTVFSPILPLVEDSLLLSHGEAGGLFISLSIGHSLTLMTTGRLATILKLTPLSGRSMALGVIMSVGVAFGMGGAPFLLGLTADHFNFRVGIFWLGLLTSLSSLSVQLLKEEKSE